jgi:hypothetical protein
MASKNGGPSMSPVVPPFRDENIGAGGLDGGFDVNFVRDVRDHERFAEVVPRHP